MSNVGRIKILGKLAPPNDVTGFTGSWNSIKRTVNFAWSAVDNLDLAGYEIRQGTSWNTATIVAEPGKQSSGSISIEEGVAEIRTYLIKAVDTSGIYSENYASVDVAIDTGECPLLTPTGLSLSTQSSIASDGTDRVTLLASWDNNAEVNDNFHHYQLMMEEISSGHKSTYATENTEYQWEVEPNKEYGLAVQAVDVSGNHSSYSSQVTKTSVKDNTAPATPTWQTTAVVPGFKVIGLRWQKNTESDLSHYEVQRSGTGNFSGEEIDLGNKDGNFTTDTDLAVDTTYYYRVRAVDTSTNESGWSVVKSTTTLQVEEADIAYDSITANHIDVTSLDAISADIGTVIAGKIYSNNWATDNDDNPLESSSQGTKIDLDSGLIQFGGSSDPKLEWDGTTLSINGQINTWNASGDSTKIDGGKIYAGSSVQIGNTDGQSDYCYIDSGDIDFYYYFGSSHHLYKSLKRLEIGECESDVYKEIPGYWKSEPQIMLSPRDLHSYNKDYSGNDQTFNLYVKDVDNYSTGQYKFKPRGELIISSGNFTIDIGESESEACGDNSYEPYIYLYIDGTGHQVFHTYDEGGTDYFTKGFDVSTDSHDIKMLLYLSEDGTNPGLYESYTQTYTTSAHCTHITVHGKLEYTGYLEWTLTWIYYIEELTSHTVLASGTLNYIAIGE